MKEEVSKYAKEYNVSEEKMREELKKYKAFKRIKKELEYRNVENFLLEKITPKETIEMTLQEYLNKEKHQAEEAIDELDIEETD
jgi:ABC-type multidrug transport system ATPase subunit